MKYYIGWLACKQVFFPHKKAGLFFMTLVSMLGVMIGIAALVITLSVMGGFEEKLRSTIFAGLPHVEITNEPQRLGWSLLERPLAYFKSNLRDIDKIAPYIKSDVVIKHKDRFASVSFMGIDARSIEDIWGFSSNVIPNAPLEELLFHPPDSLPPLLLGRGLASQLRVWVGSRVSVLVPAGMLSGFLSGRPLLESYKVAGIYRGAREEYDSGYALADLSHVRKYMADYDESLDRGEYVTGIAVTFSHPDDVDEIILNSPLRDSPYHLLSWKDAHSSLLMALLLEKLAMGAVLFLIVVVAAFSLSGTVMMTVHYQRRQISLLRGLGMPWHDVVKMFVAQGMLMGGVGLIGGMIMGVGFCLLIRELDYVHYLSDILPYYKIPVRFLWADYGVIAVLSLMLTTLASFYPAYLAGKKDPGAGLRY